MQLGISVDYKVWDTLFLVLVFIDSVFSVRLLDEVVYSTCDLTSAPN